MRHHNIDLLSRYFFAYLGLVGLCLLIVLWSFALKLSLAAMVLPIAVLLTLAMLMWVACAFHLWLRRKPADEMMERKRWTSL